MAHTKTSIKTKYRFHVYPSGYTVLPVDLPHGKGTRYVEVEVPREDVARLGLLLAAMPKSPGHAGWHFLNSERAVAECDTCSPEERATYTALVREANLGLLATKKGAA